MCSDSLPLSLSLTLARAFVFSRVQVPTARATPRGAPETRDRLRSGNSAPRASILGAIVLDLVSASPGRQIVGHARRDSEIIAECCSTRSAFNAVLGFLNIYRRQYDELRSATLNRVLIAELPSYDRNCASVIVEISGNYSGWIHRGDSRLLPGLKGHRLIPKINDRKLISLLMPRFN